MTGEYFEMQNTNAVTPNIKVTGTEIEVSSVNDPEKGPVEACINPRKSRRKHCRARKGIKK